jgi:flagella basal body P-ring formation protein FlgA
LILLGFISVTGNRQGRGFPSLTAKGRRSGSIVSACLVMLLAPQSQAASVSEQIDQALRNHLQPLLQHEIRQHGWQQPRLHLDNTLSSSTQKLQSCTQPLQVKTLSPRPALLSRQRYRVECAAPAWNVNVTSQADVSVLLLVARHTLERDQSLGADDVHTRRQSVSKHRQGIYGRAADIEGLSAKRRIRAGQVLSPPLLGAPLLVRRGQMVTIVATHDGIEAATQGEALSNGSAGDLIRVRNQSSEKVIETQVTGEGVVTSTFR